jgi:NADH:ubiquinone oxidoreductase subunit 4 (subunit M)
MAPLVAAIVWLGIYPTPILRRTEAASRRFVQMVEARAAAQVAALPLAARR